ncbi:hypothetical protein [Helicobacter pylori]|uniref:hypothetical protein n=1 Tax=Helicobacter pylori TaxID=210 RepID=UPI002648B015|nr:hypothetical protein [Helicobacter pylori]
MRPVGNALELKLCKIPTIGTQSENQTLPTGNISLGSPIVFSGLALHDKMKKFDFSGGFLSVISRNVILKYPLKSFTAKSKAIPFKIPP